MRVLATGAVDGPEVWGIVRVVEYEDRRRNVELTDLLVTPGTPDVGPYTSPYPDGRIDGTATDLESAPHDSRELRRPLPPDATATTARSGVIYCRVYSVHFGHGTLDWHDFATRATNSGNAYPGTR